MENHSGNILTGECSSPSFFDRADDFVWPELSSSGELSDINNVPITVVSVPTTPESTPNDAVSSNHNAAVSDNPSTAVPIIIISDGEDVKEETGNVSNVSSRKDLKLKMKANDGVKKRKVSAMECLIEVLKQMYAKDGESGSGEKVDILETVKRRGITFPRHRDLV